MDADKLVKFKLFCDRTIAAVNTDLVKAGWIVLWAFHPNLAKSHIVDSRETFLIRVYHCIDDEFKSVCSIDTDADAKIEDIWLTMNAIGLDDLVNHAVCSELFNEINVAKLARKDSSEAYKYFTCLDIVNSFISIKEKMESKFKAVQTFSLVEPSERDGEKEYRYNGFIFEF